MTLISILGDYDSSIIPVSYEFKEKLDTHIIVYDDAKCDVKNAQRIVRGQRAFLESEKSCDYRVLEVKIDEDSYERV